MYVKYNLTLMIHNTNDDRKERTSSDPFETRLPVLFYS
jgi:hypothetical protein